MLHTAIPWLQQKIMSLHSQSLLQQFFADAFQGWTTRTKQGRRQVYFSDNYIPIQSIDLREFANASTKQEPQF